MKNFKNLFVVSAVAACLLLASCSATPADTASAGSSDTESVAAESSSEATPVAESTVLTGTVEEVGDSTIVVADAEGNKYTFSYDAAMVETGAEGVVAGAAIEVSYTGTLDAAATDVQTATISKIKVIVADAPAADASSTDETASPAEESSAAAK